MHASAAWLLGVLVGTIVGVGAGERVGLLSPPVAVGVGVGEVTGKGVACGVGEVAANSLPDSLSGSPLQPEAASANAAASRIGQPSRLVTVSPINQEPDTWRKRPLL